MKLKGFFRIIGSEESNDGPPGIRPATEPQAEVLRPAPVEDASGRREPAPPAPAGVAVVEAVRQHPTAQPREPADASDDFDLDAAFAGGGPGGDDTATYPPSTTAEGDDVDEAALRELFVEIAAQHSDPMKSFMAELNRGNTSKGMDRDLPADHGHADRGGRLGRHERRGTADDRVFPIAGAGRPGARPAGGRGRADGDPGAATRRSPRRFRRLSRLGPRPTSGRGSSCTPCSSRSPTSAS